MGHDHTHPVIVAFVSGIVLYLIFSATVFPDYVKRMLFLLTLLVLLLLLYQRFLELP